MKIEGKNIISAPAQEVWEALNDPQVLTATIPGCQVLEKLSDTKYKATVYSKIGPIKVKFDGEVEVSDIQPPDSYTLSGSATGGPAGNVRGSAAIRLLSFDRGTLLSYDIDADVTGKLAQLGQRLITSTTKMLAGKFFSKFNEVINNELNVEDTPIAEKAEETEEEVLLLEQEVSGAPAEPAMSLTQKLRAEVLGDKGTSAAEEEAVDAPAGVAPAEIPDEEVLEAGETADEERSAEALPPPQTAPSKPKTARRAPKPARPSRSGSPGIPLTIRIAMVAGGLSLAFLVYVWMMSA